MKLSFDRPATRKLELWATAWGVDIDDLEAISAMVVGCVDYELQKIRDKGPHVQPKEGGEKP